MIFRRKDFLDIKFDESLDLLFFIYGVNILIILHLATSSY